MALSPDTLLLFAAFVAPGLVGMTVYRLLMPARLLQWGEAVTQGLFYGILNFVLLFPLILRLADQPFRTAHPWLTWTGVLMAFGVIPALWPVLLLQIYRWKKLRGKIRIPYPTAWDFFFGSGEPVFVLVHLRTGDVTGGFWGRESYAASYPNDGDIYIETAYRLSDDGVFLGPIPDSRGILLRRDEYAYIEVFNFPSKERDHG